MKTNFIITLLVLIPAFAAGQQTTQLSMKLKTGENEKYYVLKTDHSVKQGAYIKRNSYNEIVAEGFYKNDLKDSIWNGYAWGHKLKNSGKYKNGFKTGIWSFYDYKGVLELKFDFSENKIIFFKPEEKNKEIDNIKYPIKAQENSIMGSVEITLTIDKNGKASNYRITKRIGGGCDEEALRVVQLIPQKWYPGKYKGESVSVDYVIPVSYKLE